MWRLNSPGLPPIVDHLPQQMLPRNEVLTLLQELSTVCHGGDFLLLRRLEKPRRTDNVRATFARRIQLPPPTEGVLEVGRRGIRSKGSRAAQGTSDDRRFTTVQGARPWCAFWHDIT